MHNRHFVKCNALPIVLDGSYAFEEYFIICFWNSIKCIVFIQCFFINQVFQNKCEFLVAGRCFTIDGLRQIHFCEETDNRTSPVGRQVTFTLGIHAVYNHASVIVHILSNHQVSQRCNNMAVFR